MFPKPLHPSPRAATAVVMSRMGTRSQPPPRRHPACGVHVPGGPVPRIAVSRPVVGHHHPRPTTSTPGSGVVVSPQVPSPWSSCPHPPMGPHLSWLPPPESPPPGSPFPSDPLPWVSTIGSSFLTVVTSRVPNPLGSPPLGPHLEGPCSPVTPSSGCAPLSPHLPWLSPPGCPPQRSPSPGPHSLVTLYPGSPPLSPHALGSPSLMVVTSRVPNPFGSPPLGPHLQGPHSPVTPSPGSLHLGPHLPWLSPPGSPSQGHHSLVTLSPGSPSLGLHALGSPSLMVVTSRVPKPFGSPPPGSLFPSDPLPWVPTLGSPSLMVATSRVPNPLGSPPLGPHLQGPHPWVPISHGCHLQGSQSLWVPTLGSPSPGSPPLGPHLS